MYTQTGDIYNCGNFAVNKDVNITAGSSPETESADFTNAGTIQSTDGGVSLTSRNGFTNTGTVQANAQIKFAVGGTLTNQGTIESTSSNVQAHIGRNFKNIAVYNNESTENRTLIGGIIEAGGNVQVDYNLDNEGIGVASSEERIDGIYNSGLIWAKGDKDPVKKPDGTVDANSGSGNIWLRSSYNIENTATGQMIAGRQITLNARDFLHNYGLIQGVTYLDIKSIMGYVYNHTTGRIISTGGNIALSSGQANLQIDGDTNGQKKEEYRKFTPIIIEGKVEATSDDDDNNQTKEGNIEIKAYLGDIYVNGATIETKPELGTNGEVKAVAGNVILDAAQNITIGFKTEQAKADDPTTQAGPNGENKDKYERDDEREYFINTSTLSQKAAEISGSNITLISGSGKTISMSTVNNTLTASDTITINTDSMNIVGGTFNAGTLNATGELTLTGGTVTSDGDLTISGAKGLTIGNGAGISTGGNLTFASSEGAVINDHTWDNQNGSVTLSGKTGVTNNATITSSNGIGMTSAEGTIVNNAVLTAKGGAVSFEGKGDITNNALIEANGSVYIISTGGKVTNRAGIIAGKNFATPAASLFSLRARAMAVDDGSVVIKGSGSVNNSANISSNGGSVIISGNSGIENTANITASNDVSMTSSSGSISNSSDSTVTATGGSVSMSGSGDVSGGTITGNDSVKMTGGGNVTGGTVTGSDVILAGGSGSNVTASSITVDNSLQLQGDNITATNVSRSDNTTGALNVDVSGAGGSNSTALGKVDINISGNVVFGNVNVSNANVKTSGTMEVEKLHVENNAQFTSNDTTVNVYGQGVTPAPDAPNPIQDKGDGNTGWLTLTIDKTGVQSTFVGEEAKAPNNIQDSAVQLSGKLVDYNPYDTYLEQYGDVADLFGRSDLIQASERPTGETATREEDNKVVLKQDADGLRLEEQKQE